MPQKLTNVGAVCSVYFSYFVYAMGLVTAGQLADPLAAQWHVEVKDVIAVVAWEAVGKLLTYPFAGPFADRFGRKASIAIGVAADVIFFLTLPFTPSVFWGTVVALIFGVGNSFLDAGSYPTLMESNPQYEGTMNILIKAFMSAGQFVMPLLVSLFADAWRWVPIIAGLYMAVMLVAVLAAAFPDYRALAKKQALALAHTEQAIERENVHYPDGEHHPDAKQAHATVSGMETSVRNAARPSVALDAVVCLIFVFCVNGMVYLSNQALPQIGSSLAHLTDAQGRTLTQAMTLGSLTAVLLTAALSVKISSIHFVPVYALFGVVSLVMMNMSSMHTLWGMRTVAFLVGYFVSGGIMQLVLTALSDFFPAYKGRVVAWYWEAGALGGFLLPYAIRFIVPSTRGLNEVQKAQALALGYSRMAHVAVGFAIVACVAAVIVYMRHRALIHR